MKDRTLDGIHDWCSRWEISKSDLWYRLQWSDTNLSNARWKNIYSSYALTLMSKHRAITGIMPRYCEHEDINLSVTKKMLV